MFTALACNQSDYECLLVVVWNGMLLLVLLLSKQAVRWRLDRGERTSPQQYIVDSDIATCAQVELVETDRDEQTSSIRDDWWKAMYDRMRLDHSHIIQLRKNRATQTLTTTISHSTNNSRQQPTVGETR